MVSVVGTHEMLERDADKRCLPWLDFVRVELEKAEDGSVFFSISPTYWREDYVGILAPSRPAQGNQKETLQHALLQQVMEISAMGHEVILISPMVWPQFACRETVINLILGRICNSPTEGISKWNEDALSSFRQVSRESAVELLDLNKVQCPELKCVRTVDGIKIYSLGYSHLSAEFGVITSPRFLEILEAVD